MAKANDQDGAAGLVNIVDVGPAAAPFGFIKIANIFILTLGATLAVGFIAQLARGELALGDAWAFALVYAIYGFAAVIAWRNLGVLHAIVQPLTLTSLLVLAAGAAGFIGLMAVTGQFNAINWDDETSAMQALAPIATYGLTVFFALFAAIAAARARGRKIKALDLRMRDLITALERYIKGQDSAKPVPPRKPVTGSAFLALGFGWLLALQFVPDELMFDRNWSRLFTNAASIGYVLLFYSRFFFQPEIKKLLAADTRAPILFLRSFEDDEKRAYMQGEGALFDFSLESRLGGHFGQLGPFIAVGSPKEKTAQIGAARAQLADDEWQATVLGWMKAARNIVLMAGATRWVEWELSKVVGGAYTDKLILVFPQSRKWFGRRKDAQARYDRVREAFAGSVWSTALARELKRPQDIRAFSFAPDGRMTLITARSTNRNSYHLAAMVAHYLMLARAGALG